MENEEGRERRETWQCFSSSIKKMYDEFMKNYQDLIFVVGQGEKYNGKLNAERLEWITELDEKALKIGDCFSRHLTEEDKKKFREQFGSYLKIDSSSNKKELKGGNEKYGKDET
jgi:hypothetical protein